jgi:hypothetical protein
MYFAMGRDAIITAMLDALIIVNKKAEIVKLQKDAFVHQSLFQEEFL